MDERLAEGSSSKATPSVLPVDPNFWKLHKNVGMVDCMK